jgi:hypothetical protein
MVFFFFFYSIGSYNVYFSSEYPFDIWIPVDFIVICVENPVTCLDSPVLFVEIQVPQEENKVPTVRDMMTCLDFQVS